MAILIHRFLLAVLIYSAVFGALAVLHDYPQLRQHMEKVRRHDPIAERRQWLTLFYLVNEAGSGLKFYLTGDEKYMAFFPSPGHLLAARKARALNGDWQAQLSVGRMYFKGQGVAPNRQESLRWLSLARDNAADARQRQLAEQLITTVKTAEQPGDVFISR